MNKNNQVIALLTDALTNVAAERKEAAITSIASAIRLVNETTTTAITTPAVAKPTSVARRGRPVGSKNGKNARKTGPKPGRTRFSVDNIKSINERLSNGVPVARIAKDMNVSYQTIYTYASRLKKTPATSVTTAN